MIKILSLQQGKMCRFFWIWFPICFQRQKGVK